MDIHKVGPKTCLIIWTNILDMDCFYNDVALTNMERNQSTARLQQDSYTFRSEGNDSFLLEKITPALYILFKLSDEI